ncbi:hypothetical protein ACKXGF_14145 [Alkalibacillus sp. S2W]|uniref:hypothetical protein n=1 Tax=Alkalibacillus sp. S2W TaxID=3386553 RepID=UPI00398CFCAB
MHIFLAEYKSSTTTISILDQKGKAIANRDVEIPEYSFVNKLTKELIELSHEQELYHDDIFGIGVVANYGTLKFQSKEEFQQHLESSFGFLAVVDVNKENVIENLLSS